MQLPRLIINSSEINKYLITGESLFSQEFIEYISEFIKDAGYQINVQKMSYYMLYLHSLISSSTRTEISLWNRRIEFDSSKARKELGFNPIPVRDSVKDMIESMFELGFLNRKAINVTT